MVEITATYVGKLRCTAVHGPSSSTLETDAPVDNHGRGERFSPTDLMATALGTCMVTTMGIFAQRHQVDMTNTRVRVEKHMSTEAPRRIAALPVEIFVPLPADHPQAAALERAAHTCPVHLSLHPEIEKPLTIHWEG